MRDLLLGAAVTAALFLSLGQAQVANVPGRFVAIPSSGVIFVMDSMTGDVRMAQGTGMPRR